MQIRPSCWPVGMNIAPLAKTGLSTIVFNLDEVVSEQNKKDFTVLKLSLKVVFD
jgi:hypothetical protein